MISCGVVNAMEKGIYPLRGKGRGKSHHLRLLKETAQPKLSPKRKVVANLR